MSHLFDAMVKLTKARVDDIPAPVCDLTEAVVKDVAERAARARQAGPYSHLCVWDAPHAKGERTALCGATVTLLELAHGGEPTCPECRRRNAEDEASLEALQ